MDRDATTLTRRELATPAAPFCHQIEDPAQPAGIDQVGIPHGGKQIFDAIVRIIDPPGLEVDRACRPE
jgi:hypothetical protein